MLERPHRTPARTAAALGLTAALVAFGGFGAGDHNAVGAAYPTAITGGSHPPKAEYVRRLARLCDARHRAVMQLGVPFSSPTDYARRGSDLIRIERNFDAAATALPLPAEHRLADRAISEYHRYRALLPPLVRASRRHARRAWLLLYEAQGYLTNASDDIQRYGGRGFCNIGP